MAEILVNLNPNQRFWIVIRLAILISIIEAFSQFSLKNNNIVPGIIGYICVASVLLYSFRYEGLGHMNLVWSCISIIVCYILGCIYLKEPFNKYTFIAILLALGAIYFAHQSDEV